MAEACASAKNRLDRQREVMKRNHDEKRAVMENKFRAGERVMIRHPTSGHGVDNKLKRHISKGRYVFRIDTAFGTWSSPPREVALFSLKTTCGLGPFDRCNALCRSDCTGVKLRDIAPDATLASDPELIDWDVPTLAPQTAVCRATRKLHGASLCELCKRLLINPAEAAEKILTTSMHAPFDTPIEDESKNLPLTLITTSADVSKAYTRLELDDGQITPCVQGANLIGQVWEEICSGGIEMLKEPFHVVCTSVDKTFFEHSAAVVHVADDLLQKTRFFENNRFTGNCMAALVTLGAAERAPDGNEDLLKQLLAAIAKVPYVQIGRYGAHVDRRYVTGDKWDKDGILALKSHLVQVLGHHRLRNTPKASATFPLRQLHQMQVDSSGKANGVNLRLGNPEKPLEGVFLRILAPLLCFRRLDLTLLLQPESQPSTSRRSYDASLHSTRGGRINRHVAAPRSGPRSTNAIDPQLLNNIISALQPSSHPSKPHRQQKRK
ncbi:hypothetical protein AAVH_12085 [Aphelenchoides avenae]|nr:hypothetical protein AAVH_12085 [Aphelenchus avenae]